MTEKEIMRHVDHTQLKAFATWEDIKKLCDEAVEYQTASVCIPPCYIQRVKEAYGEQINICTVVGFPLGYSVTEAKIAETKKALEDGASEIDMVINLEPWDDHAVYDRLGLEGAVTEILGVSVPSITIPVKPGRNLASIVEGAAINNRNRKMGHNAALELTRRMDEHFKKLSEEEDGADVYRT